MQVKVDKKLAFKIAGQSFTIKSREQAKDIRDKFLEENKDILKDQDTFFGLMEYNALDQNYKYFLGFKIKDKSLFDKNKFISYEVPEGEYLEVPVDSEDGLKEGYRYTYEEYFPNKKYFHGIGPDIEAYKYDNGIKDVKLFISLKENPHA